MTHWDEMEERLTAGISERMIALADIRPGMRVLDLATGKGEPLLRIARRVGPGGHVLGIDPLASSLVVARRRADQEGLGQIELRAVAAEALDLPEASYEAVLCRWGLPYTQDPVSVLRRVRSALTPGSPLVAALWSEYERISWYWVPREVTEKFVRLPVLSPDRPGPIRLGRVDAIRRDFTAAGLDVTHIEEQECTVVEAESADEIVAWARSVLGRWVEGLAPDRLHAWETALAKAAAANRSHGWIRLGGITRLVVARASARKA